MSSDGDYTPREARINRVALFAVTIVVAVAAVLSAFSNSRSEHAVSQVQRTNICSRLVLTETINALNQRSTYSITENNAEVVLHNAQTTFVHILLHPGNLGSQGYKNALNNYFQALQQYNNIVRKATNKQIEYPFPTEEDFDRCLE